MSISKIGDKQVKAVEAVASALPFPVVLKADLASATAAINNALLSGKKAGAAVVDEDGALYIATGSAATDAWTKATTTAVTPA